MRATEEEKAKRRAYYQLHKERFRAYNAAHQAKLSPEKKADRAKRYGIKNREKYRLLRLECIRIYGGRCVCCGESRMEFLAFDHKNGGGTRHRAQGYSQIIYWLQDNGFPDTIQLLCHNCNQARGFYGQCPHERERTHVLQSTL